MRSLIAAMLVAAVLTPAAPALAGDKDSKPPKAKKICKTQELTGSRMPKRTCKTQEQWDAEAERNNGDKLSTQNSANLPS